MSRNEFSDGKTLQLSAERAHYAPLLEEQDGREDDVPHIYTRAQPPLSRRLIIGNAIVLVVSMCCFLLSAMLYSKSGNEDDLLRKTTFYSTVVDSLKPKWSPVQYITHPITSKESIFRQPPSDEVDAAWDRITDIGVLVLSTEDVKQIGKDPSTVVKAPESWGQGSDAHLAHLDGIHLLHCLNSMRQSLHFNFDRYHPNGISKVYASHLSHCQEALVKHLMCQPSVELITYNWVERQDHPFPDFDGTRKCWDFEQLLDWQEQHRVQTMSQEKWKVLRKPVNVTPLPIPLLMLEAYNVTREEAEAMPL